MVFLSLTDALRTNFGLSNREAEVAAMVAKGLRNKEVANQLFVTEKTIKFHLTNIFKKMNVKSRSQLIVACIPLTNAAAAASTAVAPSAPVETNTELPSGVGAEAA